MGQAQRDIWVELPPEDLHQPGDTEPMVGELCRSMYGTQDASKIFQGPADDGGQWGRVLRSKGSLD